MRRQDYLIDWVALCATVFGVEKDHIDDSRMSKLEIAFLSIFPDLSERQIEIIKHRFSSGGGKTFEEVGELYGVTRERIRQVEQVALRKIRFPTRSIKLKTFVLSDAQVAKNHLAHAIGNIYRISWGGDYKEMEPDLRVIIEKIEGIEDEISKLFFPKEYARRKRYMEARRAVRE